MDRDFVETYPCFNLLCLWKIDFEKKEDFWEISVSCTIQECDVTKPYYSIFVQYLSTGPLVAYGRLENKRKFQTFSFKSSRDRLQEVSNVVIWLGKFWYFGKIVAYERVAATRGSTAQ